MMPTIEEIMERLEAVQAHHKRFTAGQLGAMLISSSAHTMGQPGEMNGEDSLAYLIMEAVLSGELIPINEAAGG